MAVGLQLWCCVLVRKTECVTMFKGTWPSLEGCSAESCCEKGKHMTSWSVITVTLLMLMPLMTLVTSIRGWILHFKIEGDTEY
jgi:hypothetical protein